MFDSNQMNELRHVAADRYQRAVGGGAHQVYASSAAFYQAKGWNNMSKFEQACMEMLHRYRVACSIQIEHYRMDCLTSQEGFYHGDTIPF